VPAGVRQQVRLCSQRQGNCLCLAGRRRALD
jgi:hypothetical protein